METGKTIDIVWDPQNILKSLKLHNSPILSLFKSEELNIISRTSTLHIFESGTVFMRQGDISSSMFVILSGCAQISIDFSGDNRIEKASQVDVVTNIVGESGMLTGQRREAFGLAGPEGCVLLELTISELKALSLKRLSLRAKLISLMARAKKEKILNLIAIKKSNHSEDAVTTASSQSAKLERNPATLSGVNTRRSIRKVISLATVAKAVAPNLEEREERVLQAILARADAWVTENSDIEEEYEARPLISFLEQYPNTKYAYISGMGVGLMHRAAFTGNKLICSQLLKCGCPLELIDANHKNVLHHVVEGSAHCNRDHFETLRMFLERGVDLIRDCDGNSPADISKRDDISLLLLMHLRDRQLAKCCLPDCVRSPLILCSGCRLVKYCCMDHLRSHLHQHGKVCARASPACQTSRLSRLAIEAIRDTYRDVNNMSLEDDWQIKKFRGLSMVEYVSHHRKRLYFSIWDRFTWIVRARLSVKYLQAVTQDHRYLPVDLDTPCEATRIDAEAQIQMLVANCKDLEAEPDYTQMSLTQLKALCMPNFKSIRKR